MRVVVAPDSFGGTLGATAAAEAIAAGWRRAAPGDDLALLPLADGGGPGFVEVLHTALGGTRHERAVTGPFGDPVRAAWLLVGATAYVESAAACGLHLVPRERRTPDAAGRVPTRGVGELVAAARDDGAREIVVGLGGSPTTDGVDVRDEPGAGAAGGLAGALLALGARRVSGADLVGELTGLDAALDGAGLAVTGEGSFDWRSLRGTPVTAVARSAAARGVPCLVLAGQVLVGRRGAAAAGVDAAYAVADGAGGSPARSPTPSRRSRHWPRRSPGAGAAEAGVPGRTGGGGAGHGAAATGPGGVPGPIMGRSNPRGTHPGPCVVGSAMTVENTVSVDSAAETAPAAAEETHGVELTDAAAIKARTLLEQEGRDDMHLRIAVQPGGCAGLRYQLFFDDRELDGDLFRAFQGLRVGVDRMSAPYLQGAVIDFVDTIEKQGFTIDNPNAGGSCACGDSFN